MFKITVFVPHKIFCRYH